MLLEGDSWFVRALLSPPLEKQYWVDERRLRREGGEINYP